MAAKTGHEKNDTIIQVGELSLLFGQAIQHIHAGRRTVGSIRQLRRTLQLFKENTLGAVMSNAEGAVSKEDLRILLSEELRTVLPSRVATYCKGHGLLYVGELFVKPFWKSSQVRSNTEAARLCRDILEAFGVPFNLNLVDLGWEPPYASDERVLASLKRTLGEIPDWKLSVRREDEDITTVAWHLRMRYNGGHYRMGNFKPDQRLEADGVTRTGMFISRTMLDITGSYRYKQ